jgi:2-polyprenyl-3-methyl-5-hydroxy-6-metoxy-1,4-benzoquinol methylase
MDDGAPVSERLRDAPGVIAGMAARLPPELFGEFLTFTRCLFVLSDAGFADCDAALVESYLEPARGLDVYDVRQRMFAALQRIVPNPAFNVPPQPGGAWRRRAARSLRRRWYLGEVARRDFARRDRVTAAAVAHHEWRSADFYAALTASSNAAATAYVEPTYYAPVAALVTGHLAGVPRPRILDIGSGPGNLLRLLAERLPGARLAGTNLLHVPGTALAIGEHSPFPDACFDAVTATKLLEHAVDPAAFVQEMARMLKPDGICVAVTNALHMQFLSRNPLRYAEALAGAVWPGLLPAHPGMFLPLTPLPMYHRAYAARELERLFTPCFQDVRVEAMGYTHLRKFGLAGLAPHLPLVRRFGRELIVSALRPR